MCRTILILSTAVLLASIRIGTAATAEESLLKQAEKEWNEAIGKKDVAAARKYMADDFVLVGVRSTGSNTVELATWLEGLAAMRIDSYHSEPTRVKVYGDSAVVSVKGDWHILFQGREINENFFLTDVWTKRADGWKIVLRHSSPYPH